MEPPFVCLRVTIELVLEVHGTCATTHEPREAASAPIPVATNNGGTA